MFYVLSKILGIFINPVFWIVVCFAAAILFKRKTLKKRLSIAGLVLLLFFSNAFILNEVLLLWEDYEIKQSPETETYDYGIVLSGMTYYDTEHKRVNFLRSADRVWQALKLYKDGRINKILITGGPASFFYKDTVESVVLKEFLVSIGVPDTAIVTEELARNTHENALFTKPLVSTTNTLLLVTSAMHMRRAHKCFTKVGLNCDTFATDFFAGSRHWNIDNMFIPQANALFKWNALIHEWVGVVMYKITGYI